MMKTAKFKFGAMAMTSLLLAACGGIAKDVPAHEWVNQAMVRQVAQDNRYNFKGTAYLSMSENPQDENLQQGVREFEAQEAELKNMQAALTELFVKDDNQANPDNPLETKSQKFRRIIDKHGIKWLGAFSIPYEGAVDLPNGKMEFVPTIQMKTRLSSSATTVPMMVDLQEGAMYADLEALTFWFDPFLAFMDIPEVDNRLVSLKLSDKQKNSLPLRNIYHALPKSVQNAYATLPEQAFSKMEMDEFGKKIKATQRIRSQLNWGDYSKVGSTAFQTLRDELVKQGKQDGVSAEDYQKTIDFLDNMLKMEREMQTKLTEFKQQKNQKNQENQESTNNKPALSLAEQIAQADKRKQNNQKATAQSEAEAELSEINSNSVREKNAMAFMEKLHTVRFQEDVYLDKKGRLLAKRTQVMLPEEWDRDVAKFLGKPKSVRLHMDSQFIYHKSPIFTLKPNKNNVFDVSCILQDIKQCDWVKDKNTASQSD